MFPGLNREGPRNTPKVDKRKTILTHIGVKRRRMMFVVPAISPPFLCITFATLEMGKRVAESREEAQNFDHAVLLRTKRTPRPPLRPRTSTPIPRRTPHGRRGHRCDGYQTIQQARPILSVLTKS